MALHILQPKLRYFALRRPKPFVEKQEQVNVVKHDGITRHLVAPLVKQGKEVIHCVIAAGLLNEGQPPVTGKVDKVNSGIVDKGVNGHGKKDKEKTGRGQGRGLTSGLRAMAR